MQGAQTCGLLQTRGHGHVSTHDHVLGAYAAHHAPLEGARRHANPDLQRNAPDLT